MFIPSAPILVRTIDTEMADMVKSTSSELAGAEVVIELTRCAVM